MKIAEDCGAGRSAPVADGLRGLHPTVGCPASLRTFVSGSPLQSEPAGEPNRGNACKVVLGWWESFKSKSPHPFWFS